MKRHAPLVFLGLSACAAQPEPIPAPASLPAVAAFGEWAGAGDYAVRPLQLVEDSRCPADVQCIWAGRLVIRADVARDGRRAVQTFELAPLGAAASGLTLIEATPDKRSSRPIAPSDYRFRFRDAR